MNDGVLGSRRGIRGGIFDSTTQRLLDHRGYESRVCVDEIRKRMIIRPKLSGIRAFDVWAMQQHAALSLAQLSSPQQAVVMQETLQTPQVSYGVPSGCFYNYV
jgi:hypothetical protein